MECELTLAHNSHARLSFSGRALLGANGYMNWQMLDVGLQNRVGGMCLCIWSLFLCRPHESSCALLDWPTGRGSQR